jgi:glycosyltransferase involved in cell wall biosynthesis
VLNLRALLIASDATICVSASEHEELVQLVGHDRAREAVVIRNGVRIPPAVSDDDRLAVRASLRIAPSDTVAIWVGSLDERKDPLIATRAAEEAQVTLLMVGDGPLRAEVGRAASEHVRVLGPRTDVERLLAAADIFVITSQREGLAFSLLEAMAYGVAPIVTDLPENREAVGDAGIVVPVGDRHSLERALSRAAANASERVVLGERARERVAESFDANTMVDRTRTIYDGLG